MNEDNELTSGGLLLPSLLTSWHAACVYRTSPINFCHAACYRTEAPTLTPLNRLARFLCPACYLPAPLLLLPCLCSAMFLNDDPFGLGVGDGDRLGSEKGLSIGTVDDNARNNCRSHLPPRACLASRFVWTQPLC